MKSSPRNTLLAATMTFAIGSMALAATPANAFCLQYIDFCDQIQLDFDAERNLYGLWDNACDGVIPLKEIIGTPAVIVAYEEAFNSTISFRLNLAARTSDQWSYVDGGATPPIKFADDVPFIITAGNCEFPTRPDADAPPTMLGRR